MRVIQTLVTASRRSPYPHRLKFLAAHLPALGAGGEDAPKIMPLPDV
jgi:hypothetical protein